MYQEIHGKAEKDNKPYVVVIGVTESSLVDNIVSITRGMVPSYPFVSYVEHRRGHRRREYPQDRESLGPISGPGQIVQIQQASVGAKKQSLLRRTRCSRRRTERGVIEQYCVGMADVFLCCARMRHIFAACRGGLNLDGPRKSVDHPCMRDKPRPALIQMHVLPYPCMCSSRQASQQQRPRLHQSVTRCVSSAEKSSRHRVARSQIGDLWGRHQVPMLPRGPKKKNIDIPGSHRTSSKRRYDTWWISPLADTSYHGPAIPPWSVFQNPWGEAVSISGI